MVHNLVQGLGQLGSISAVVYLVAGALIGMIIGVVPGLGGVVVLAIVLAFIQHFSLTATLCLFLGTYCGQFFSASISAILLNTPAHPESFAVTFDGFPMARRGEAGRALGLSAGSTCIGGLLGCAGLVGFVPIMHLFPNFFHPPEYVALCVAALILVGAMGAESASKALLSAGLGIMVASVGPAATNGLYRYTFNSVGLSSGVDLVALVLGLFAVTQMILVFGTGTAIAGQDMFGKDVSVSEAAELHHGFARQVVGGIVETVQYRMVLITSALIGVVTGAIPGIGGFAANFVTYGVAQQTSRRRRHLFGTGIPEGIIAPEGSSLAKEAGSMVPLLGLGIPGGVGGAIFLSALSVKGVQTGFAFTNQYPSLVYEIMWIILFGGFIGTVVALLLAPWLAKVTVLPGPFLVPFIVSLSVVSPFVSSISFFSVVEVFVFAVVGLILRRLRYSLASFAVGLVLGPTLENNIYLTRGVYPGFTFLRRPFADVLFAIAIGILVWRTVQLRQEARSRREHESERVIAALENEKRTGVHVAAFLHPFALLELVTTVILVGVAVPFTIYGAVEYPLATSLMPCVAGGLTASVAIFRLPIAIRNYVQYLALKGRPAGFGASALTVHSPAVELAAIVAGRSPAPLSMMKVAAPADGLAPEGVGPVGDGSGVVERSWARNGQYTRELAAIGWCGFLVLAAYGLGFDVAIPVFCLGYGLFAMGHVLPRLRSRAFFAAGSAVAMGLVAYELQNLLHVQYSPVFHL